MAKPQEHGVRRAPDRGRVSFSRPRHRPWRRPLRDRRRSACDGRSIGRRHPAFLLSLFADRSALPAADDDRGRDGSDQAGAATVADSRADVRMALPGIEESERARVVDLSAAPATRSRRRPACRPPATITVTVHPTVEAFGRATGQPWWMSAATEGTEIELLPLTILRQRGQIERTIRHEVAHVLVDSALAKTTAVGARGCGALLRRSGRAGRFWRVTRDLPERRRVPAADLRRHASRRLCARRNLRPSRDRRAASPGAISSS